MHSAACLVPAAHGLRTERPRAAQEAMDSADSADLGEGIARLTSQVAALAGGPPAGDPDAEQHDRAAWCVRARAGSAWHVYS